MAKQKPLSKYELIELLEKINAASESAGSIIEAIRTCRIDDIGSEFIHDSIHGIVCGARDLNQAALSMMTRFEIEKMREETAKLKAKIAQENSK